MVKYSETYMSTDPADIIETFAETKERERSFRMSNENTENVISEGHDVETAGVTSPAPATEQTPEKLEDLVVTDELVETEEPLVDLEDTYEKEEPPSAEDKKILEFCLECSWITEAPIGRVSCPACGGKVIRQRRSFVQKARSQNRFKRGV